MSVELLTAAFQDRKTSGSTRLVLLALANISDHEGRSWPSIAYLVACSRVSERSVRRALADLEGLGMLSLKSRLRENGSQASNEYFLHLRPGDPGRLPGGPRQIARGTPADCQGDPGTMAPLDPSVDTSKELPPSSPGSELAWPDVPESLRSEELLAALNEYAAHRREKRAKLTRVAQKRLLAKLERWGPERSRAALEYSMTQGWTGVFEEKSRPNARGSNPEQTGVNRALAERRSERTPTQEAAHTWFADRHEELTREQENLWFALESLTDVEVRQHFKRVTGEALP